MACKFPIIIKNKFISTVIGSLGIYFGIGFILPISYLSVYITSYINLKQDFVNMHYGYFLNLILTLSMAFSASLGGILENKIGFTFTTLLGTTIVLITNIFFFRIQNIWICYCLTLIMGVGAGISISLLGKNLTLYIPNKKGIIVSIFGLVVIILAGGFLIGGEKIISLEGVTIEPDEEVYKPEIAERTYLYFMLGFLTIPLGDIIFLLFTHEYRKSIIENESILSTEEKIEETKEEIEDNIEEKNEKPIEKKAEKPNKINFLQELKGMEKYKKERIKKVVKTFRFWRIVLVSFLLSFPISFMITTGRTFGAIIGIKGSALQFLMAIQGASIILIGPIFGIISDKKGPMIILRICSIVSIIPGVLLLFFIDNTVLYIISFVFIALGLVSKMVSFNPLLMEIYGIQESVILGGIINGFGRVGEIITTVSAFVISFFYSNNEIKTPYKIIFIAGSICSLISFLLLCFESNKKFDYNEENIDEIDKIIDNDIITEAKESINI